MGNTFQITYCTILAVDSKYFELILYFSYLNVICSVYFFTYVNYPFFLFSQEQLWGYYIILLKQYGDYDEEQNLIIENLQQAEIQRISTNSSNFNLHLSS